MKNVAKEFLIIKRMKEFIVVLEKEVVCFPKKDRVLKDRLEEESYRVLELIYFINYENDRINDLYCLLSKCKMLDYYLFLSKEKGCISYKRFLYLGRLLREIVKMSYGWMKYEKNKDQI